LRVHLLPRFGARRIDEVGDEDVDDLKLALSTGTEKKPQGLKPKSVNNILGTLHNILKHARKRKLIAAVPEFEWFGKSEQPFDFLDFEEAERLLEGAAKVSEWECAIVLAIKTGMRLGELRALRWSDVDLVKRQVRISRNLWRHHEGTPKGGRSRTVDLPASAVSALKAHRHLRGERVFLDPNGEDYSVGAWRHGLYRACRRTGLRQVGWHVLRHTVASHLEPVRHSHEVARPAGDSPGVRRPEGYAQQWSRWWPTQSDDTWSCAGSRWSRCSASSVTRR
jgi:integrase